MSRFIAVDRDTAYLLPPSVDEWLPQDHLARFVVEVIDQLDLSELVRQYAGRGSDAYHPAMLLGLLVYGYASGVHSSRKIERACHDSVAFRFIAANTQPDHDGIATFRRRFLPQIEALFVQVLVLAREMKCLKLEGGAAAGFAGSAGGKGPERRALAPRARDGAVVDQREEPVLAAGRARGQAAEELPARARSVALTAPRQGFAGAGLRPPWTRSAAHKSTINAKRLDVKRPIDRWSDQRHATARGPK